MARLEKDLETLLHEELLKERIIFSLEGGNDHYQQIFEKL